MEQKIAQLLGEVPEAPPEGSSVPGPEAATLAVRAENEAERLDRIRNPSKYLGK